MGLGLRVVKGSFGFRVWGFLGIFFGFAMVEAPPRRLCSIIGGAVLWCSYWLSSVLFVFFCSSASCVALPYVCRVGSSGLWV